MDKQEFGQSEALLHLREMPLPEPIEVHFSLREADLVEGIRTALRVQRSTARLNLATTLVVVMLLLMGQVYIGLFFLFFVVFMRHAVVHAAKGKYRKEPLLQEPMTWVFGEDEVTVNHPRTNSRMDWSVYKRVVETPNLFMLFPQENLYNPIPKRAFADAAEMERFRELVREKGIEIKVVGRG